MEIITGLAGVALSGMVAKGIHVKRKINRFNKELENYLEQEAPQSVRDYFHRGVINTKDLTQDEVTKLIPYFKRMYELPVMAFFEEFYKEDATRTLKLLRLADRLEGNSGLYEILFEEGVTREQSYQTIGKRGSHTRRKN